MALYRHLDPPTDLRCIQCHILKPTATESDWQYGWPRPRCRECRRENQRARQAILRTQEPYRTARNADTRRRYALAKQIAAGTVTPPTPKVPTDAEQAAAKLKAARVAYGRWKEREIRAGRMQRPPNINPYTGQPRPTGIEKIQRIAQKAEDAPRPRPPRWAELMQEAERLQALVKRRNQDSSPHPHAKASTQAATLKQR